MPAIAATTPHPNHKFKVYTSGQKRRVTPQIKREFKRRAAQASGDAINAVLAAAGYNFRRLLAWLRFCWGRLTVIERAGSDQSHGRDQSGALALRLLKAAGARQGLCEV
jgi:hypothetical protein